MPLFLGGVAMAFLVLLSVSSARQKKKKTVCNQIIFFMVSDAVWSLEKVPTQFRFYLL